MTEKYIVDEKKMKEGLHELMKHRVNQVLNHAGPFTLALAAESYFSTLNLLKSWGYDCSEYETKIKEFEDEVNSKSKLEQKAKQ